VKGVLISVRDWKNASAWKNDVWWQCFRSRLYFQLFSLISVFFSLRGQL